MIRAVLSLLFVTASIRAADVVIVGAGVAGLSAALEAGRNGADVVVVEMSSVFGGHGVMSEGGLTLIDTNTQKQKGIKDSHDLARKDFLEWGESPNVPWMERYVRESGPEIHDWLTSLGLKFTELRQHAGSSVPRFHVNDERGLGVAKVIFQACLREPNVRFVWNSEAIRLVETDGRVTGLEVRNLRTGERSEIRGGAVVLATGGYQSNLQFLRQNWPKESKFPEHILIGSGVNSTGSGHKLAASVGAALVQLDRQWNHPWGMVDPRYPDASRGISVRMPMAIWVNQAGVRFIDEHASPKAATPAILSQPGSTYWVIYDAEGKKRYFVSGSDWTNPQRVESLLLGNPALVKKAENWDQLAAQIGVPAATLSSTVRRYNELVAKGVDDDFGRFGKHREREQAQHRRDPAPLVTPPFYAIRMYALARKSMGGISTDESGHVLRKDGSVISGLYAAGEVTGEAGLNGVAALEGTFLAPSILQGRIVGRQFKGSMKTSAKADEMAHTSTAESNTTCGSCHDIRALISKQRNGYWHFEKVHTRVVERAFACESCHAEMTPFRAQSHKIDRMSQSRQCAKCHLSSD